MCCLYTCKCTRWDRQTMQGPLGKGIVAWWGERGLPRRQCEILACDTLSALGPAAGAHIPPCFGRGPGPIPPQGLCCTNLMARHLKMQVVG